MIPAHGITRKRAFYVLENGSENAKIVSEIPSEKVGFCREKQMCAVRGTVPKNKEKQAVCKDKTDRPFLGNLIDTRPEV